MKKKIAVAAILIAGCFLLLNACVTPYKQPEQSPADAVYPGLDDLIKGNTAGGPVDVLSVHGMCTHGKEWVIEAGEQFSEFLKLNYVAPSKAYRMQGKVEIWLNELTDDMKKVVLRNFAIVWSPLTKGPKQALCYDASVKTASCDRANFKGTRAKLNSELKSKLLNDCLADAMVYLGPEGDLIREEIREAVIKVGNQRGSKEDPLVLITESLGSKAIADAVIGSIGPKQDQALEALRGTKIIFMGANQIPLLNLAHAGNVRAGGDDTVVTQLRRAIEGLTIGDSRTDTVSREDEVYIVAFSDPNDLLSYELAIPSNRTTVNVRVSNSPTWFWLLENPAKAHTDYLENSAVWELINCGADGSCTKPSNR